MPVSIKLINSGIDDETIACCMVQIFICICACSVSCVIIISLVIHVAWLLFSMLTLHHCWSSSVLVWMLSTSGVLRLFMRPHRKVERSSVPCWYVDFILR